MSLGWLFLCLFAQHTSETTCENSHRDGVWAGSEPGPKSHLLVAGLLLARCFEARGQLRGEAVGGLLVDGEHVFGVADNAGLEVLKALRRPLK